MTNAKNSAPQKVTLVTPVGIVGAYPYLQKPDMGNEKFPKPRGEWSCRLHIPVSKAQGLMSAISKEVQARFDKYLNVEYPQALAAAKAAGKRPPAQLAMRDMPFYEDGEGNVVFVFKAHASYTDKNSQEVREITLRVYDSKGARIEATPAISKGSEIRAEFAVVPYASSVAGVGARLQLSKVQLLKLVTYSGGNGDTFGSDLDEDYEGEGFVAPKADTAFEGLGEYDQDECAMAQAYAQTNMGGDF